MKLIQCTSIQANAHKNVLGYMENKTKEKTNKQTKPTNGEEEKTPPVRKKAIHTGSKTFPLSVWIGLPIKCRENENKIISVQFFYFISAIFIVYLFLFRCGRCCCGWCCFCAFFLLHNFIHSVLTWLAISRRKKCMGWQKAMRSENSC